MAHSMEKISRGESSNVTQEETQFAEKGRGQRHSEDTQQLSVDAPSSASKNTVSIPSLNFASLCSSALGKPSLDSHNISNSDNRKSNISPFPLHDLEDEVEAPPTPPHRVLTKEALIPSSVSAVGEEDENGDGIVGGNKASNDAELQQVLEEQFALGGSRGASPTSIAVAGPSSADGVPAVLGDDSLGMRTPPAAELPYARQLLAENSSGEKLAASPLSFDADEATGMERLNTVATETKKKRNKTAAGEEEDEDVQNADSSFGAEGHFLPGGPSVGGSLHERTSVVHASFGAAGASGGGFGSVDEDFWYDEQEPQPLLTRCRRCHSDEDSRQQANNNHSSGKCQLCDHHHHHRRSHSVSSASSSSSCITMLGEVPPPPDNHRSQHLQDLFLDEDELDKEKRLNRAALLFNHYQHEENDVGEGHNDGNDLDGIRPFIPASSTTTGGEGSVIIHQPSTMLQPTKSRGIVAATNEEKIRGGKGEEDGKWKKAGEIIKITRHDPYSFNVIGDPATLQLKRGFLPAGRVNSHHSSTLASQRAHPPADLLEIHRSSIISSSGGFNYPTRTVDTRLSTTTTTIAIASSAPHQREQEYPSRSIYHQQQQTPISERGAVLPTQCIIPSYVPTADQWDYQHSQKVIHSSGSNRNAPPLLEKTSEKKRKQNKMVARATHDLATTSRNSQQQPATISKRQMHKRSSAAPSTVLPDDGWGDIFPVESDATQKQKEDPRKKKEAMAEALHGVALAKHEGKYLEFVPYPSESFPLATPPVETEEEEEGEKESIMVEKKTDQAGRLEEEQQPQLPPHPSLKRVFIGQLPYECTEMQLSWIASTFGDGVKLYHFERIKKIDRTHFRRCVKKQKKQQLLQQQEQEQEDQQRQREEYEDHGPEEEEGEAPSSPAAAAAGGNISTQITPLFQPTGCFHCYTDNEESVQKLIEGLHRKVLVDDTGVWVVRSSPTPPPQVVFGRKMQRKLPSSSSSSSALVINKGGETILKEYCEEMKRDKSKRFQGRPYGTMVVQEAVSKFDPSNIPPPQEALTGGN